MDNSYYLLSTAYFPPISYFSLLTLNIPVLIEMYETYARQTYRNRCIILGASGPQKMSVPVKKGSSHKVPVSEIEIDYQTRWQQIHLRSIESAYKNSPYYDFYATGLLEIIDSGIISLLDLNMKLLNKLLGIMHIECNPVFTQSFEKPSGSLFDLRYAISPKGNDPAKYSSQFPRYNQVFSDRYGFVPDLSILDLLFNMGPGSRDYLMQISTSTG